MRMLVTAGNTMTLIDKVRCITNLFTGKTGTAIALHAHARGHDVTLLTSHPEVVREMASPLPYKLWKSLPYRTFDDLMERMKTALTTQSFDAVVHCAAVNDYHAAGIFAPAPSTSFDLANTSWRSEGQPPRMIDKAAGKVKSDEPELWLRMVRSPKLVDMVRDPWGFQGQLVKFKLEVGLSDPELVEIAEKSRVQSRADWMVANTLEGAREWAYLGSAQGYERIARADLPHRLLEAIETQAKG
jgi:phosphopantothenoylcysteine synthetase/decarboxylase